MQKIGLLFGLVTDELIKEEGYGEKKVISSSCYLSCIDYTSWMARAIAAFLLKKTKQLRGWTVSKSPVRIKAWNKK